MTGAEMDGLPWMRAALSLLAVLVLAAAALWLLRRYASSPADRARAGGRLHVVASQIVDGRTRLLLVRRDGIEHLLAVAPTGVTVIETFPAANSRPEASAAPC